MTNEERDIQRKLKVLQHVEKIGNAHKACRYFGIERSSFYRWRDAYQKHGEAGLKNAKSIPKNQANRTPPEIVEKILHLRRKYHLLIPPRYLARMLTWQVGQFRMPIHTRDLSGPILRRDLVPFYSAIDRNRSYL